MKPLPVGTDHVYFVPTGTIPLVVFIGETAKPAPPHITVVISVIAATGLTVTVTVKLAAFPQAAVFGVIR